MGEIRTGRALRNVLLDRGISPNVFYPQLDRNPALAERYTAARVASLDTMAEDAVAIADDPAIDANKARVMVDTRKWFLSKLAPKKYGDRIDVSVSANISAAGMSDAELAALTLRARAALPTTIDAETVSESSS
jgi:hypothetical protein